MTVKQLYHTAMKYAVKNNKQNRGFVAAGDEVGYSSLNQEDLLELLKSSS